MLEELQELLPDLEFEDRTFSRSHEVLESESPDCYNRIGWRGGYRALTPGLQEELGF